MRRKALLFLLFGYWLVSLSVYGVWESQGWYPAAGDEPHHIITGRSLLHDGSFEQTRAYEREFARGYLGSPGDAITRSNAHVLQGPRGRFSIHSPGMGIVAVAPIALAGLLGYENDVPFIKVFFVFLSGAAVIAAWVLASLYMQTMAGRVLSVLLTCFSLPLLIASNQVFPDLPAGVLGLCVLAFLAWRSSRPSRRLWPHAAAICGLACLPWLHYKLSLMAAVLAIAVLHDAVSNGEGRMRLPALCVISLIAATLFFFYNYYAFGSLIRIDPSTSIQADSRALMWFFGLSLDRWHGFLLQNPVFFIGLIFMVPFILRQPAAGIPALLAYVAVTGINAAHASPGYSFAGRHAWTGCLLLIPATIFGLGRLECLSRRAFQLTSAALVSLQLLAVVPLVMARHDLYNRGPGIWFDVYPSFFPDAATRFLPAFYNQDWWYRHATNYIFILIAVFFIGIGAWTHRRRHEQTLPLAGGLLAVALPVVFLVGIVEPDPPREALVFSARSMPRHFGIVQQEAVLASVQAHAAGIWTFGPYIRLAKGDYRVKFHLQSNASSDVKVGSWDVTGRAGQVRFGAGEIMGTEGAPGEAGGEFRIASADDGDNFETRLFFEDAADLLFVDVVLEPVSAKKTAP